MKNLFAKVLTWIWQTTAFMVGTLCGTILIAWATVKFIALAVGVLGLALGTFTILVVAGICLYLLDKFIKWLEKG